MSRVPDGKKLRREYLKRKSRAYGITDVYAVLCALAWAVGIFVVFSVFFMPLMYRGDTWLYRTPCLLFLLPALWMTWGLRRAEEEVKEVPYVPPVTPSILPAEEVLVRGAAVPSAPSETLLRATVKDEEAKAEELLRSSQGS